ncbi:MAG TPA: D-alanine--D-alanine ligase [Gemmatimonadaceae bacterium]|nr:D-alanine--D-alanine ligase [Gemmatimonadaceae bacterium]
MKITVLLGGTSAERDVSLASGIRIVQALRSRGHDVTALDPATGVLSEGDEQALLAGRVKAAPPSLESLRQISRTALSPALGTLPAVREAEVVFIGLHGGQGEDGTLQALFELCGVRYTGSGPMASAIAMDKDVSKILFRAAGVQTADWVMADRGEGGRGMGDAVPRDVPSALHPPSPIPLPSSNDQRIAQLGLPLVVKPSKQGSTVGLSIVKEGSQLAGAIEEAFKYDDEVMIERFIPGRELTVGVIGDVALPVGEIISKKEIYDYEAKYTPGMAVEEFPARLTDEQTRRVQEQALLAFRALKLRGCARIDFRMTADGEFYCLEANTLPGMTGTSLIPQGAAAAGIDFPELCERIAVLGLRDERR